MAFATSALSGRTMGQPANVSPGMSGALATKDHRQDGPTRLHQINRCRQLLDNQ